jgi:starch synthase (maltosyl-transferring)
LLAEVARTEPDVLFLAEAFTRPAVMDELAKIGFHQSYTYFTWRESRHEIEEYFTELTRGPQRDFFRPNVWPNTPDILPEHLQRGGRAMFVTRLVLAAGLAANYGIYGPAFELGEHVPRAPGSEEYLDSEKYEVRHWDLEARSSLRDVIARVNAARRRHAALQHDVTLHFHRTDNDRFVCWSKRDPASGDAVLCIVNLDPDFPQEGWTDLDLDALGVAGDEPFGVVDLLGEAAYTWRGRHNYVRLDPKGTVAHLLAVRPHHDGAPG